MSLIRLVLLCPVLLLALLASGCGQAGGETRYSLLHQEVIKDNATRLEWVVGPDRYTNYTQAVAWVHGCGIAGGGWRMPTLAQLRGLYAQGQGLSNLDPVFKTTGWRIWAEPRDASSAMIFNFETGREEWRDRNFDNFARVFGVRPAQN